MDVQLMTEHLVIVDDADRLEREQTEERTLLEQARKRFEIAIEAEFANRVHALDDIEFLDGNQWDESVKADRSEEDRPCLTLNQLPTFVDQVVGNQRKARPSVEVSAVDAQTTEQKVKNLDGTKDYDIALTYDAIIRTIERQSRAHIARNHAFEQSAGSGWGYWRVTTEYPREDSFEQEIFIRKIFNQFAVYMDPRAITEGAEKAEWGFIVETMDTDTFRVKFPDARHHDWEQGIGEDMAGWFEKDKIRIAEYFTAVKQKRTLRLLSNGRVVDAEKFAPVADELAREGITVVRSRTFDGIKILWYKLSPMEILEGPQEWPGRFIPIIGCYGKVLNKSGEPRLRGVIRHAKDPQRMYNYWRTAETEQVALAPKAPYVATAEQVGGAHQKMWDDANRKNFGVLVYKHVDGAPAPKRQLPAQISPGMVNESFLAQQDLKATTGLFDPSLGNKSKGVASGRAILAEQQQGDTATFVYSDNFSDAIEYEGKVVVDLIPKIYDTDRVLRLRFADETEDYVQVNQAVRDEDTGKIVMLNDLNVARFDVSVNVGPSVKTQRLEAAGTMIDFAKAIPEAGMAMSDFIARNMDWPGAQEIAKRLRALIPQEIRDAQDDDEKGQQPQITPQDVAQAIAEALQAAGMDLTEMQKQTDRIKAEADRIKALADMAQATAQTQEANVTPEQVGEIFRELMAQFIADGQSAPGNGQVIP